MDFLSFGFLAGVGGIVALALVVTVVVIAILLRRVVPTNMVHIVQRAASTTSYGRGEGRKGNVYYAWPSWVPKIGVTVTEFPESIFKVSLSDYEAYDSARLPFMVDVTAFFRVQHSETAAQRVATFAELQQQLQAVLQGAVRRILATNQLEEIMQSRSSLGDQFTAEVNEQIKEWGVTTVKTIEFMDIRDNAKSNSKVIANIMAKEQSRIDKESRVQVADNAKAAELAEIDARRTVEVQKQDAAQQVGIRTAEKDKTVGIANEQSRQEILSQSKSTAEKDMEVQRVRATKAAEIEKQVQITVAEAEKNTTAIRAEGDLIATQRKAEGIKAEGEAKADAESKMLMAPVTAQITLAKEIGSNDGYQTYLVRLKQVEGGVTVGQAMAAALEKADLKIISTNGGDVANSVTKLTDMFTPAGGTALSGMLAALSQTSEGKALVEKVVGKTGE